MNYARAKREERIRSRGEGLKNVLHMAKFLLKSKMPNGQVGTLLDFNAERMQWNVILSTQQALVKPANIACNVGLAPSFDSV